MRWVNIFWCRFVDRRIVSRSWRWCSSFDYVGCWVGNLVQSVFLSKNSRKNKSGLTESACFGRKRWQYNCSMRAKIVSSDRIVVCHEYTKISRDEFPCIFLIDSFILMLNCREFKDDQSSDTLALQHNRFLTWKMGCLLAKVKVIVLFIHLVIIN